ncbi:MAG: glycosyltransferase family 39 protein [Acidobacteria bacterium]|nr:glycosyltransferase family 39 protein [Acidobacteriota bacterium]
MSLASSIARHRRFYIAFTFAAIVLRLLFILKFPTIAPDSLVYGDIAKNWQQGIYGISGVHTPGPAGTPPIRGVEPTDIRMPGYPAFVALCFLLFGSEHYGAIMYVNLVFDVITCYIIAALAWRAAGDRAARIAFALAACCIFFANYVATPLTEPLAIFAAAAALYFAVRALSGPVSSPPQFRSASWVLCGIALASGILLRPDGGILLGATLVYLLWRGARGSLPPKHAMAAALTVAVVALAPLVPWTVRNWRVLHVFQPLAPVYANTPGEFVPLGFIRWQKTWILDYSSVEDIWFHVPGDALDMQALPARAFDSPTERDETARLFAEYNHTRVMTGPLDAQFGALAARRIARHPLRYYAWLPALRALDLWARPRTEMLPLDSHWWQFDQDLHDAILGTAIGLLGWLYLAAALLALRPGVHVRFGGLLLLFVVLRSAFLASMPNPEQRYVLECFPALLVFAGAGLAGPRPGTQS